MSTRHTTINCVNETRSSIIRHHVKLHTLHNHSLVFKVDRIEIKDLTKTSQ